VSALTLDGLEALKGQIVAVAAKWQSEIGDEGVTLNARHAAALSTAGEAIGKARWKLDEGVENELVCSELRCALAGYGEVVGAIENEKVLDRLFETFCIGK
jgi:tRNA modification GTPase